MTDFRYNPEIEKTRIENNLLNFEIGRIVSKHKERYTVKTEKGEFEAEITGNLRFSANSRADFPAVGDWVALTIYDSGFSLIHKKLPKYSVISRRAVGQFGEIQIIAANIDYAFLVQATDRDFNINRLERYLTICNSSKVNAIIVLTKIDSIDVQRLGQITGSINQRIKNIPVVAISNKTKEGYELLNHSFQKGNRDSYENYLKMEKEKAHYESSVAERRKKDKDFGKLRKNYKKNMNKY